MSSQLLLHGHQLPRSCGKIGRQAVKYADRRTKRLSYPSQSTCIVERMGSPGLCVRSAACIRLLWLGSVSAVRIRCPRLRSASYVNGSACCGQDLSPAAWFHRRRLRNHLLRLAGGDPPPVSGLMPDGNRSCGNEDRSASYGKAIGDRELG